MEKEKALQVKEQPTFLSTIERLATNPDVDVNKIQAFLDMQERIYDKNAQEEFNASMVKAQNRIELVVAKEKNEQTKSKYANLKSILVQCKPIYTEEGFALMFYEGETEKPDHKRVCCDIMHRAGHREKRYVDVAIQTTGIAGKAMMTQIHGEGSAFSYGRRYLTCLIFNIPTGDDDDGNAAGRKPAAFISEDQRKTLSKLIKDKNVDSEKFLSYFQIESLSELLSSEFDKAMGLIKAKK